MATINQLYGALSKAHAAGDEVAAQNFAGRIKGLKAAGLSAEGTEKPKPNPDANQNPVVAGLQGLNTIQHDAALGFTHGLAKTGDSLIDVYNSGDSWLRNQFGNGDGTYEPSTLAAHLDKPNTTAGRVGAFVGEYAPAFAGGELAVTALPEVAGLSGAGWLDRMGRAIAKNSTWSMGFQAGEGNMPTPVQTAMDAGVGALFDAAGHVITRPMGEEGLSALEVINRRANKAARAVFGRDTKIDKLAELVEPNPEIIAAADRLGYDANELLPHHYADNPVMRDYMGVMASRQGDMKAAEGALINKMDETVRHFVESNGGKLDGSELSSEFAEKMEETVKGYDDLAQAEYDAVGSIIPEHTPVDAPKTLDYIDGQADRLGGIDKLSPIEKRISDEFRPGELRTFARFDDLRQDVGDAVEKFRSGDKRREYRRAAMLYEPMSEDIQAVADKFGVGDKLTRAKAHYAAKEQADAIRKEILGRNLNADLVPKVKEAMKGLGRGSTAKFEQLMKVIPQDYQEPAVMSALAQMFKDGARSKEALHLPGFVDWMREVEANSKSYEALTSYMPPDAVAHLGDIYTMFSGVRRGMLSEVANTGGRIAQGDKLIDQAAGIQKFIAEHPVAASVIDPAISLGAAAANGPTAGILTKLVTGAVKDMGTGTAKKLDKLILEPDFTQAVIDSAGRSSRGEASAATRVKRIKRVDVAKKAAMALEDVALQDEVRIVIDKGTAKKND